MNNIDRKTPFLLLSLGTVLLALSQVRWGVGLLAWVAPIPFLLFLHRTQSWRSRLLFMGFLIFAWTLAAAKYITPPLPYALIVLNGISFGIVNGLGYLGWSRLQRGLPSHFSTLLFAAILVTIEWLQYSFTPLASHGAAAYTQLENLPFLQTASLFGIMGIDFLMYWFAAVMADGLANKRVATKQTSIVISLIVLAHVGGAIRIGAPSATETVTVASVGTDMDWFGGPAPNDARLKKITDNLFDRSRRAAMAGAQLVVWNEVATFINKTDEPTFWDTARKIARNHKIHIVLAYTVPIQKEPFKVENKYTWINPAGKTVDTYLKHKPVPGEPSVPGDGNAKAVQTAIGKLSGAICYDFDFPQVGLDRAKKGADIVFVPSSDTLGVDPFHTQIAAIRAIEGGYSVIRSTRMGLSAGIDPQGRFRAWSSANESEQKIILATIPSKSVWTLYSVVGDLLAYLAMAYLLIIIGVKIVRRPNA